MSNNTIGAVSAATEWFTDAAANYTIEQSTEGQSPCYRLYLPGAGTAETAQASEDCELGCWWITTEGLADSLDPFHVGADVEDAMSALKAIAAAWHAGRRSR